MTANLCLKLFGSTQIHYQGQPLTGFVSGKVRALLIYMAVTGRPHSRDHLAELLWADTPASMRVNLRKALSNLRQLIGDLLVEDGKETVAIHASRVWVDLHEFERLNKNGALSEAIQLYHADFLSGFNVSLSYEFESWALGEQSRLNAQMVDLLRGGANRAEQFGDLAQAIAFERQILQFEPWHEADHQRLIELLARNQDRSGALAQFEKCVTILAKELDAEPSSATMSLIIKVRNGDFDRLDPVSLGMASPKFNYAGSTKVDLLEMPDPGLFCGREFELEQLRKWVIDDECRVCAILGVGGVGKTSLAAKLIHLLLDSHKDSKPERCPFDKILWHSLLNAPPFTGFLRYCIQFLSDQRIVELSESIDDQLRLLMQLLQQQHCLLVLDNLDTTMQVGGRAGLFRTGYEGYGRLIERIAQSNHQSCLIVTSREQPQELTRVVRSLRSVRSLPISGLTDIAAQDLLRQQGLIADAVQTIPLIHHYSGHPLALKLVAETIGDLYFGDVAAFLHEGTFIFEDVGDILEQQLERLSPLENEILVWLAIEREPISVQSLSDNLLGSLTHRDYLETLRSLQQRSLLERQDKGFTLQNVVMEFVTERLLHQLYQELSVSDLTSLNRYALLKAHSKDYIRQSQERMLLCPLVSMLLDHNGRTSLEAKAQQWLTQIHTEMLNGYAGGNLLNLLIHLGSDLNNFDFAHATIRHAYLQGATLQDINFASAVLQHCAFLDTFGNILAVAFSPQGSLFAAATMYGQVRVWRAHDAQLLMIGEGHSSWIWAICFSPDGRWLASGCSDRTIGLWDMQTYRLSTTLQTPSSVNSVCFSPDGSLLASSGDDHLIRLWDVQTGKQLAILEGHQHRVWSVAFSPNGTQLVSGSQDQTVRLWDITAIVAMRSAQGQAAADDTPIRGHLLQTFSDHTDSVIAVAFSPNGHMVASGGNEKLLRLWDVRRSANGSPLRKTFHGHTNKIRSVAFNSDGSLLASGSEDWSLRLWRTDEQVEMEHPVLTIQEHTDVLATICFSPDDRLLLSGSWDQTVRLWEVQTGKLVKTLGSYTNRIWGLNFSCDGTKLASANDDGTIRLWDVGSGHLLKTLSNPTGTVRRAIFSRDGKLLATCGFEHYVRLWDIATGQILTTSLQHNTRIVDISFSPDGGMLAGVSIDKTICLWNVQSGELVATLRGNINDRSSICFSPNGKLLACGEDSGRIALWDVQARSIRKMFTGHTGRIAQVDFSPDGKLLASAGEDWTARLWNVETGDALSALHGHAHEILTISVSHDGKLVASGSIDKTIRLWDIDALSSRATERQYTVMDRHTDRIFAVDFAPNRQILASGGDDGSIILWDANVSKVLHTLRHDRPYERMNITRVTGISEVQRTILKALGAVETGLLDS